MDSLRIAIRTLRKQPVFASVVIVSLALAIALNTTMYGVLDALIHPRMDVRSPGQLYTIEFFGDYRFHVDTYQRDDMVRSGMHSYEAITRVEQRMYGQSPVVQAGAHLVEASPVGVAANYFEVLGVHAKLGRTFVPSDETAGTKPVVISEKLADELFPDGASPIGQVIDVDHSPHVVIGVVSRYASIPGDKTDIWTPTPINAKSMYVRLIRIRDGATRADAERELQTVADRIVAAGGPGTGPAAFRLHSVVDADFQFKGFHLAMVLAVVSVLLVACANLANIQLARGIGRSRELALRSALGATRTRLIRHLLIESGILAAAGLVLGLVMTYWSARLLTGSIPERIAQYVVEPQWSWRVLTFALAATVCCVMLIGLLPAIHVSRADPNELLKSGAGTGATKRTRRQYGVLVATEIALALVLSSGAAVLLHASMDAADNSLGYDPHPLAAGFAFPRFTAGTVVHQAELLRTLAARLQAIHGVDGAAAALRTGPDHGIISFSDETGVHEFPAVGGNMMAVSPSFLRTVRLPIKKGRDFLDGQPDEGTVIIDEHTARLLWPNSNPIGQQIKFGDHRSSAPFFHVVGVAADNMDARTQRMLRRYAVNIKALGAIYYLPGVKDTVVAGTTPLIVQLITRSNHSPERMPLIVRSAVRGWPDFRFAQVMSMEEALGIAEIRATRNFVSHLFVIFAALGLTLAAFGVYGVVAHSVAERRRELGVRIALGATSRDILHAVLRESVVVGLAGVAVGLLLTKYGVWLLAAFAIEDDIFNAPLFAFVALVLFAVAAASAFAPAVRATRIDPTESLRCE